MRLILASTSSYRRELLGRLRLPFEAVAHRCEERSSEPQGAAAEVLAETLARAKAASLAQAYADAHIIGSDQVVDLDGELLGKPGTAEAAANQLRRLAGRTHRLVTAVAVRGPGGTVDHHVDVHRLRMRPLEAMEIERYVTAEMPVDCCGAYKIEAGGIALFDAIEGTDFTAIVGLPMLALSRMLRSAGFVVP